MVYKAVRFSECVPKYDYERKEYTIVPIYTMMHRPKKRLGLFHNRARFTGQPVQSL